MSNAIYNLTLLTMGTSYREAMHEEVQAETTYLSYKLEVERVKATAAQRARKEGAKNETIVADSVATDEIVHGKERILVDMLNTLKVKKSEREIIEIQMKNIRAILESERQAPAPRPRPSFERFARMDTASKTDSFEGVADLLFGGTETDPQVEAGIKDLMEHFNVKRQPSTFEEIFNRKMSKHTQNENEETPTQQ